jgi:hypothetical protein
MRTPERFPLVWPQGYPVTEKRQLSNFKCTFAQARDGMINEFKLLINPEGLKEMIISCNMPHDKNNFLSGKSPLMYDNPGVAVYFKFNGEDKVIACDAWKYLHENFRAIQYTVAGLRSFERHKCTKILSNAMAGFKELSDGSAHKQEWYLVLGVWPSETAEKIRKAYLKLAKEYHPDNKVTGNEAKFKEVQEAYEEALKGK